MSGAARGWAGSSISMSGRRDPSVGRGMEHYGRRRAVSLVAAMGSQSQRARDRLSRRVRPELGEEVATMNQLLKFGHNPVHARLPTVIQTIVPMLAATGSAPSCVSHGHTCSAR